MGTDFVEFRKLQEVGIFSYLVYSLAKSYFNGWGFIEGLDGRVFGLKIFEPSEENPYCVVVNSVEPRVLLFT